MITSLIATSLLAGTVPTLTIRVEGDGFLRFAKNNQMLYCRTAKLTATPQGLVAGDGSILVPRIIAPNGTTKLEAAIDGTVTAQLPTGRKSLGRFVIAIFDGKTAFSKVGNYITTTTQPTLTNPGEWIAGVIRTNEAQKTVPQTPVDASTKPKETHSAPAVFAAARAEVTVNLRSTIDTEKNDKILLGSVAKIEGDPALVESLSAVDFGRAPLFGSKRGLTLIHVRAQIAAAGIDVRKLKIMVPEGATVEREGQLLSQELIDNAVSKALKTKFGFETKIEQKYRTNQIALPVGPVSIDVSDLRLLPSSEISGRVDIAVNGKIANSVLINYTLPQLSMIKKGDVVRLRLISNFASVEVSAKATTAAYLGQTITVQTDNGTTHTGTLIGSDLVEVKL